MLFNIKRGSEGIGVGSAHRQAPCTNCNINFDLSGDKALAQHRGFFIASKNICRQLYIFSFRM